MATTARWTPEAGETRRITRSKTGCMTCRRRKTKCDEKRPACRTCQRLNLHCDGYQHRFRFHTITHDSIINRNKSHHTTSTSPLQAAFKRKANEQDKGLFHDTLLDVLGYDPPPARRKSLDVPPTPRITFPTNSTETVSLEYDDVPGFYSNDIPSPRLSPTEGSETGDTGRRPSTRQIQHGLDRNDQSGPFDSRELLYRSELNTSVTSSSPGYTPSSMLLHDPHSLYGVSFTTPELSCSINTGRNEETLSTTDNIDALSSAIGKVNPHQECADTPNLSNLGGEQPCLGELLGRSRQQNIHSTIPVYDDRRKVSERGDLQIDSELELVLLDHWRRSVVGVLPIAFQTYEHILREFPAFEPALLALSACHLSQVRTSALRLPEGNQRTWVYVPSRKLQIQSREYYTLAVGKLTMISPGTIKSKAIYLFATLLAFAYIEHVSGTYRQFNAHLRGIEQLISSEGTTIIQRHLGRQMISAWLKLRAVHWWQRAFYSAENFNASLEAMTIAPALATLLLTQDYRQEAILVYMIESRRLSSMLLMERFFGRGGSDTLSSKCCSNHYNIIGRPFPEKPWRSKRPVPDEDWVLQLSKIAHILDDWHDSLAISNLPIDILISATVGQNYDAHSRLKISPLKFKSHAAAMDYAEYSLSQLLIDKSIVDELTAASPQAKPCDQITPWMLIFLRVTAGLDQSQCLYQNTYTIGISSMLIECALRNNNSAVDDWISEWLRQLENMCVYQEGILEVCSALAILQIIREERSKGRDIYSFGRETGDIDSVDGVFVAKSIPSVIYGRVRRTGQLFCERIELSLFS